MAAQTDDPIRAAIKASIDSVTDGAGAGDSADDNFETEAPEPAGVPDDDDGDAGAAGDADADGDAGAEGDEDAGAAEGDDAAAAGDGDAGDGDAAAAAAAGDKAGDKGADDKSKLSDADKAFAKEHGLNPNKRDNRIPFSRVTKITANAVKKAETRWRTDVLGPVSAKVQHYEERLSRIGAVENMMFNDKPAFIEKLRTIPGYEELLGGVGAAGAARGAANKAADEFNLPAPKADTGYTIEELGGILRDFGTHIRTQTIAEVQKTVAKDYGGVKTAHDTATAEAELNAKKENYVGQVLTEAAKWEGFAENKDAILAAVKADTRPIKTWRDFDNIIGDAYRKVVLGKAAASKASVRAELKNQPRSTSTTRGAGGAKTGPKTTGDPIRDAIVNSIATLKS